MSYRVRVKSVLPAGRNIPTDLHCYIGISLTNPDIWDRHLSLVLDYADEKFESTTILIADYVHRFNEAIEGGTAEGEASLSLGDSVFQKARKHLGKHVRLMRWKDVFDGASCQQKVSTLHDLYKNNEEFADMVLSGVHHYLRKRKSFSDEDTHRFTPLSVSYVLEELAVCWEMIDSGHLVQLYVGTRMNLIEKVATGCFGDVSTALKQGWFIELTLKRR